eukprot:CAMPEP_0185770460 /NCGR_PEP_ID=MMETSP1174-20130828/59214_1 /TAXON_ID=35687 /ORGANISM="Dictyocha speculum, Strain CCMP1381" /LENGTH=662 /DNA_ID=CAMNT_0028455889 /DNA_START=199 /DNA_END=2187 /DNA_ORIENTATION=-
MKASISPTTSSVEGKKTVTIVTTSSLPWMTGTSVNPLLRAVQLAHEGMDVMLMLPWLPKEAGQDLLYRGEIFDEPEDQEKWLREWISEHCESIDDNSLGFAWYPARYIEENGCIIADQRKGDILQYLPPGTRDLAILEEPEHLNWYHHGGRWSEHFQHVAGVVHTNYVQYTGMEEGGWLKAPTTKLFSSLAFAAHCDVIIQLSATLKDSGAPGDLSKVCNVHGVRNDFINIGRRLREKPSVPSDGPMYFLGKKLWAKGYRELLDFMQSPEGRAAQMPPLHLYGSGTDEPDILSEINSTGLNAVTFPAIDHADEALDRYTTLVNPSTSDVLCTVTAEALAMGKNVIIAEHPSNEFFYQFQNCRTFSSSAELVHQIQEAAATPPEPISDEELHLLSWEAATNRLVDSIIPDEAQGRATDGLRSRLCHSVHFTLSGGTLGDLFRVASGAPPDQEGNSLLMNPQVMQYMEDIQPFIQEVTAFSQEVTEMAENMQTNVTSLERFLSLDMDTLRRFSRSKMSVQNKAAAMTIATVFPLVGLLGIMPGPQQAMPANNMIAAFTQQHLKQGRPLSPLPAPGRLLATLETLRQTGGTQFPLKDRVRLQLDKISSETSTGAYFQDLPTKYRLDRLSNQPVKSKRALQDLRTKLPSRLPSKWSTVQEDSIRDA